MRFSQLEAKDVVDVKSGKKIGYVNDLEIDQEKMQICFLIVCEIRWKDFILVFCKPKIKKIAINQIVCIGKDVILVKC